MNKVMLMTVYLILFLLALFYTIFLNKKLNFLLVYLLSSFFYHFPALLGKYYIYYTNSLSNVSSKTYIVLIINCLVIFFFSFFNNNKYAKKDIYNDNVPLSEIKFIKFVTIINYLALFYFLFSYKDIIFRDVFDKLYVMSNMSRYLTYYMYFSTFWSIYVFNIKTKLPKYVYLSSILSLLFTFLLGNRSFIVIAFLGIMFAYIHDRFKKGNLAIFIKKHKKIFIEIVVVLLFMFFIKHIYSALFSRNFDAVKRSIFSSDYYTYSIRNSEPNGITRNLDLIITSGYEYDSISYIEDLALIIPGLSNAFNIGPEYSEKSSTFLYGPHANNGSSFLGEAYANGKYIMVFLVTCSLAIILSFVYSFAIKSQSALTTSFFITLGIDYSFYIARNSSN